MAEQTQGVPDRKSLSRREYMRTYRKTSRLKEMWYIFSSNRLALVGLAIILVFVLLALFANVIADYDTVAIAAKPTERFTSPCAEHILGTDEMGRDIFARIIHGARISLRLGVLSVLVGVVLSSIIGSTAGSKSRRPQSRPEGCWKPSVSPLPAQTNIPTSFPAA